MKKLICAILALIMIVSLCACGKTDDQKATEPQSTPNSTNTESNTNNSTPTQLEDSNDSTEPSVDDDEPWIVSEMNWPSFPKIEYIQKNIGTSDVQHSLIKQGFDFDFDQAYQDVSNNEFIKENYIIGKEHSERMGDAETYNDVGCIASYSVYDSIVGYYKDTYKPGEFNLPDFKITFGIETNEIDSGYGYFCLEMANVAVEKTEHMAEEVKYFPGLQDELHELLQEIIGESYASYLVYAQNEGETGYNHVQFKRCDTNGPEEGYSVKREITSNEITMVLSIQMDPFKNSNKTFSGDHVSMYKDFKYKIDDIFPDARVGQLNLLEFDSFAEDYMKLSTKDYVKTLPPANSLYIAKTEVENTTKYYLSSRWEGGMSITTNKKPAVQLYCTICETGGEISDILVSLIGSPYAAKDEDMSNIRKISKSMLALWLPSDFDLSHINDTAYSTAETVDWTLFGQDCTIRTNAYASNSATKGNYGGLSIDICMK